MTNTGRIIDLSEWIEQLRKDESPLLRAVFPEGSWNMDTLLKNVCEIGKGFDTRFVLDDDNLEVYRNLIYWAMNDSRFMAIDPRTKQQIPGRLYKGIYIAGKTGTGKSVAMNVLRTLYQILKCCRIKDTSALNGYRAMAWMEKRADEITDDFSVTGSLTAIKSAPVLCIQDLGCEPEETLYMGNRIKVMQNVLGTRGDNPKQLTFITSNIPLWHPDLAAKYSDRVQSRLYEMTNLLILNGKDRRQNF